MTKPEFIPAPISLLQIISSELKGIAPLFKPKDPAFAILKNLVKKHNFIAEASEFLDNKMHIKYMQLLLLLTLSLGKNLNTQHLKFITAKNDSIDIVWENNIRNRFVLGEFDKKFQDFLTFTMWKQFLIKEGVKKIPKRILFNIKDRLKDNISDLEFTKKQIEFILSHKEDLATLINKEKLSPAIYFILLAALPQGELNAFFLAIQSYFPENLMIKNKNGNTINITSFFETVSADINFLLEKVKVYFELYKKNDMPIIQSITQTKGKTLLLEILKNSTAKKQMHGNLEKMLSDQIILRMFLYSLFAHHLEVILSA